MSQTGPIVGVGDSIINADQSWAHWIALATQQPLTRVSVGGATSTHALKQLAQLTGPYRLGLITIGTNDVLFDWSPNRFGRNLGTILATMSRTSETVLIQTIPEQLAAFPGSGSVVRRRVLEANRLIKVVASEHPNCEVVDGSDLRGHGLMSVDRVHPTVRGQLLLADRAAQILDLVTAPSSTYATRTSSSRCAYLRGTLTRTVRAVVKRAIRYQPPEIRY